jgi:hypothetical protein
MYTLAVVAAADATMAIAADATTADAVMETAVAVATKMK